MLTVVHHRVVVVIKRHYGKSVYMFLYIERHEYPKLNSIWKPGKEYPATGALLWG
jgi:hypothetical protein